MEVVGNVIEKWDKETETTVEGQSCTHGYLMKHLKDLEKMQGEKCWKSRITSENPSNQRQKHSLNVVFVDDFDNCVIRNMKSVGIMWRKCQLKRKILVGRADIVTWRSRYLKEVQECRDNGHLIFYTNKTWADSNLTCCECWQEGEVIGIHTDVNLENRLIMLHVGETGGFLPPCISHVQG